MDKKDVFSHVADFTGLKVTLASPTEISEWSYGEVTKPETINYRTLKPEKDGLFDERIFGPTKDWECYCGKYKRIRYRGIICDKCGVEVTQSKVRRERMGHITLAAPVSHVWFFKGAPSKLSLLLNMTPRSLERVIYYAQYIIIEADEAKRDKVLDGLEDKVAQKRELSKKGFEQEKARVADHFDKERKAVSKKVKSEESREVALAEVNLKEKQRLAALDEELAKEEQKEKEVFNKLVTLIKSLKPFSLLTEDEYFKLAEYDAVDFFRAGMGAEALLELVQKLDVDTLINDLREKAEKAIGQKHIKLSKRLRILEGLKKSKIEAAWMILTVLPVLPPDLRPMVQLIGGRFATSDLNDLYRRVINRNNRLKHLIDLGAPEIILRNEKRMLQEAVDSLIDTSQRTVSRTRKQLRSLSDMLRGKQGRFRQNLLGKRVDYSGRSVIVVGPELNLTQCGLPKDMALELFKPFVLRELIARGLAPNVKNAKKIIEERVPEVFDILEEITKNHPVLLNRAPTLHKLGMQAFFPILIEGSAIRIHPCVCAGYNADFDGDQMAVHVPLAKSAQDEAIALMLPIHNLIKPADGTPITVPNKEMALGCYYLTTIDPKEIDFKEEDLKVYDKEEAVFAYQVGQMSLRTPIKLRWETGMIVATVGRILFNELLPKEMQFFNEPVKAATIKSIITQALEQYPNDEQARLIDAIKNFGFWGATISGGVSVSVFDNLMISNKDDMIGDADKKAADIDQSYQQGLITLEEKRRLTNEVWIDTTEQIADLTWENLPSDNPVRTIIESGGARASKDQLKQLAAMRGLVVDPLGKIVELPTKSNFRQGLSIFEYVTSTRGSRKGLTDSALKTADAGYLTRRLVDVAHDLIIRTEDCHTTEGITIERINEHRQATFDNRIFGRLLAEDVVVGKKTILTKGTLIDKHAVAAIEEHAIADVVVRSPITCGAKYGLCVNCYGVDFSTNKLVEIGTPVGVVAAQSIGEPGTQLTMRVRHAGGIVGLDVTQGLPRVEELFEARTPKVLSPISEISGRVDIIANEDSYTIRVQTVGVKPVEEREYSVPLTSELKVKKGELVESGKQLSGGYLDIKEVLQVKGLRGAQNYIVNSVQNVYESQGIPIFDKHFEVIVRKMSDKVRIESAGDTDLLPGELTDRNKFEEENSRVLAEGGEPSIAQVVILGITRAALYTESWLSAASFQETTNVLTNAAIPGSEDMLVGLKENIIIGRLIPVTEERARIDVV